MKEKAFTLAEVLITLGIIGVVAALTIPTLMQKHRIHVVETKFKQGHSLLAQADEMVKVDYGLNYSRERFAPVNADQALEMLNKYYTPYIKFYDVKKGYSGALGLLQNGYGMYLWKGSENPSDSNNWNNVMIFLCLDNASCNGVSGTGDPYHYKDLGKSVFITSTNGKGTSSWYRTLSQDEVVERCQTDKGACTAAIINNGWKIPDNYPYKF